MEQNSMKHFTEDEVREQAKQILGFFDTESAKSGVGQLTSWKALGFKGKLGCPDGWYFPHVTTFPAIIAEFKASNISLGKSQIDELLKNYNIVKTKYKNVIAILWNGEDIKVYKNGVLLEKEQKLQNKEYFLGLFSQDKIDKSKIYLLTKKINDSLHFNFGIKNLYHRMIFTACALVAKRYGALLVKGMTYNAFRNSVFDNLSKSYEQSIKQNTKLNLLLDVYSEIKMNITDNQQAIDEFIECVSEISDNINSDFWNGEDVMAIFFNEFNRYKKKSEHGQVFTPDHITSLMYKIIDVNSDDIVLDAACGSGAFLVKAMCNMIKDSGGMLSDKAKIIKSSQLYGIELDREIFALACANMLIHKDGKTNLEQMDSSTEEAKVWIESKNISKVLMNPPFENKYKCLEIVENVLNSVKKDTPCAFILPDNKLEKNLAKAKRVLKNHRLEKIIKLPEEIFSGVTTSIFVFRAKVPQNNKSIFACYIQNDGLETVKNQGRQDIKNKWAELEEYWTDVIFKQSGDDSIQWLSPDEYLHYKMPETPFSITYADFKKSVLSYVLFLNKVNELEFKECLINSTLYGLPFPDEFEKYVQKHDSAIFVNSDQWKEFVIRDIFNVKRPIARSSSKYADGETPFVASGNFNNGIEKFVEPQKNEILDKGNCISVSPVDGSSFYQPIDFLGRGGAGSSIILLYGNMLNERVALFLITILRSVCKKYNYSNMCSQDKLRAEKIMLPVDKSGNPDWNFMEQFIKNMPIYKLIGK